MYVGSFVSKVLTIFSVFLFCCYVPYSVGMEETDIVNMNFLYSSRRRAVPALNRGTCLAFVLSAVLF